jgi:hypothetical protein
MKIKCWFCLNELDTETDYMVISPSTGEKCLFYCEKCGTFTTDQGQGERIRKSLSQKIEPRFKERMARLSALLDGAIERNRINESKKG